MKIGIVPMNHRISPLKAGVSFLRSEPRDRIFILMTLILLMILVNPYFPQGVWGKTLFFLLLSSVLIWCVYVVSDSWRDATIALLFVFLAQIFKGAFIIYGVPFLDVLGDLFAALVFVYTTLVFVLSLVRTKVITTNTIWNVVSSYLLIGLTWAALYSIQETLYPGSFSDTLDPGSSKSFGDLIYFSMVTLATLGYGDIVPVTHPARSLAILETVTGVLYIAVVVASLVGGWKAKGKE
jgi:hypothetical protein